MGRGATTNAPRPPCFFFSLGCGPVFGSGGDGADFPNTSGGGDSCCVRSWFFAVGSGVFISCAIADSARARISSSAIARYELFIGAETTHERGLLKPAGYFTFVRTQGQETDFANIPPFELFFRALEPSRCEASINALTLADLSIYLDLAKLAAPRMTRRCKAPERRSAIRNQG